MSFSPSGELLASCSADRTIKLWSVAEATRPILPAYEGMRPSAEDLLWTMLEATAAGRHGLLVAAQEFLDSVMWAAPTISRSAVEEAVANVKAAFGDMAFILLTAVQTAVQLRLEQAFREGEPEAAFYEDLGTWITHAFHGEEDAELRRLKREERPGQQPEKRGPRPTSRVSRRSRRLVSLVERVAGGLLAPDAAISMAQELGPSQADILAASDGVQEHVRDALAGHANARSLANATEVLYRLAEPTGEPSLLAVTGELAGKLLCIAGDNPSGIIWLEGALRSARTVNDPALVGMTLGSLANSYRNVGRLRDSLEAYEEALALAERHGLDQFLVHVLNNIAIVYEDLGDARGQSEALRRARAEAKAQGLDEELAEITTNLGNYLWRAGDYRAAIQAHKDALAAAERLDDDGLRAAALGNLGLVRAADGDVGAARTNFLQALELSERIGVMSIGANAAIGLGNLDAADGRLSEAKRILEQGVKLARGAPPGVLMSALRALGDTQHRLGETDAAIVTLREAAAAGEHLRSQIERPGTAERIQHRVAEVYSRLVSLTADSGQVEDAFMFSECARAALLTRRLRPRSAASDEADAAGISVLKQLRRLGERAVLISYFITGERIWTFVIRADSGELAVAESRMETERFERLVSDFGREVMEAPLYGDVGETWLELGEWLIDPLLEHLRDDDVVFVVPHGPLHNLPLHALKADGQRVIERWPIAYLPAASALSALIDESAKRPRDPLVIGVAFEGEARAVAALLEGAQTLIGEELGRDPVLESLSTADLVHISAYGFFAKDEPDRSGWLLRSSEDVKRYLTARAKASHERTQSDLLLATDEVLPREAIVSVADLEHLRLRARLVTLSACESGLVRTDPADDPIGLVPTLLASGVPAVVAALWQIDPDSTEHFMLALYRHLTRSDLDWCRKPQALRLAVLELMQGQPHPYYWAPFVLIGGGAPGVADAGET